MSLYAIQQYHAEVEKIIHFGGTRKETAIRNAFYNLLNEYAKAKGLLLVAEVAIKAANSNKTVIPDGTLKDMLRQDWGHWESKDEADDLDEEIRKKFEKGYPKENILLRMGRPPCSTSRGRKWGAPPPPIMPPCTACSPPSSTTNAPRCRASARPLNSSNRMCPR